MLQMIKNLRLILFINGALAVLLSVGLVYLFFTLPAAAVTILVYFLGAYLLIEALLFLYFGFKFKWYAYALLGALSALLAVFIFVWPGPSVVGLAYAVGIWAIFIGIVRISDAGAAKKKLKTNGWQILDGILAIFFGLILLVFPIAGVLAFVALTAAYFLLAGLTLATFGWYLHQGLKKLEKIT